jgi:hypothetical protein
MYWWRNLGRMMQSGSLQIYENGSGDWTKDRKKSWRKTRIKLSKASWKKGKKFLLREFVYFFLIFTKDIIFYSLHHFVNANKMVIDHGG